MGIKFKQDAAGNTVGEDQVTSVLTQAQADAQAAYASALRVDPYTAEKIKNNAAQGAPMSAGALTALSGIGGDVKSKIGNNIATIDAQTRATRLANQQDVAQKRETDKFKATPYGQFWQGFKAFVRGSTMVISTPFQILNAEYRTAVEAIEKDGYVTGLKNMITLSEETSKSAISQIPLVQGLMEIGKTKSVKNLNFGEGFFINEEIGLGAKAREASLNSAKVALKDSNGKIIGYRARTLFGDPASEVFSFGNPESAWGAGVATIADVVASFFFDPGIAKGQEVKRLAKLAAKARAEGAMGDAAKIIEETKKVQEAKTTAMKLRDGAIAEYDAIPTAEAERAKTLADAARVVYTDKTDTAAKLSKSVAPAVERKNGAIAYINESKVELDNINKALAEANAVSKAPKQLTATESQLASKTAELKDLKAKVTAAGGTYRLETAPGYFQIIDNSVLNDIRDEVKSLKTTVSRLKTSTAPENIVSSERIAELVARRDQLKYAIKDGTQAVKDADKQIASRIRNAKLAAKAEDIAFNDYAKKSSKSRKLSELLADKTISAEEKLAAWADNLERTAGLKTAEGMSDFSYEKIGNFLTGGNGSIALERLAEMTNWQQIWRASNGKLDVAVARNIAAAKSPDEVLSAIAPFIMRGGAAGMLKSGVIERAGANFAEKSSSLSDKMSFMLPAAKVFTGPAARVQHRMLGHESVARLFSAFENSVVPKIDAFSKAVGRAYKTKIKSSTLVNIGDTDALIASADSFGIAIKLDKKVLDNILEEIATAPTPALRGYAASVKLQEAAFQQYAEKIPPRLQDEFRRATTAFKSSTEKMSSYWATQHINGAKLDFIDIAGNKISLPGPHLQSELLNSTIYFPSPAEFIKFTSVIAKLPTGATWTKVGDTLISNWWKKSVLVRPAFVIRNIAEEQLRVYGTGHISFFNNPAMALAMWLGREEGPGWRKFLYNYDNYKHTIFDKTFASGDDIADLIDETSGSGVKNSFVNIMGADAKGSFDDRAVKVLSFKNVGAVGSGHERFFDGVANQIRVLNSDEFSRVIAGATPKGVGDAIASGVTREDAIIDYFFSGAGRKSLEDFAASTPETFKNFIFTRDGLKQYLYTGKTVDGKDISVLGRVLEATGGNSSLREIIAFGKTNVAGVKFNVPRPEVEAINSLSNASQINKGKKALLETQAEFAKQLKSTFSGAGNWDNVLMNVPSKNLAYIESGADKRNIIEMFFDTATKLEKNSTFGPEFRQAYWDAINEISGALDATAITRLENIAENSLRPLIFKGANVGNKHPVWGALKNAKGNGPLSIEDAHIYADNAARVHVKELFYNANEKRLIFHQLRLIGPFMNAWENTIRAWSEIAIQNPLQVYKGIKTLDWLSSPESSSLYQLTDARDYYNPKDGFFFNDPESGQKLFWVPFAGTVMSKLASGLTGNNYEGAPISFATNPMSFNFAIGSGSILPGVGPGVTLPISVLATWNQSAIDNMPEGIKKWLFPFGRADFSSGLQSAILPSNWNRILSGGQGTMETYSSTFKPIMAYLTAGANYNLDNPDDQRQIINDTDVFARWFSIMRGVVGLVSPSSLQTKGITTDGNGDALTQFTLYKDFQDMLEANNGNYNTTVGDFLDLYGASAVFAIISSSTGQGPSNWESYQFVTKNPDIVQKYGDIWGYVYPGGGLSQEMYKWNLVNNTKKKLNPTEILQKANNTRYYAALDRLLLKVDNNELDKEGFKEAKNYLKASMGGGPKDNSDYNKFSRVIYQLKTLTEDKRFIDIPATKALRDYMYLRDKALANLGKVSTDKMLGTGEEVMAQRAWLSEQAVWIIQDNPEFQKIFYQFFANELEGK